eukprot:485584_1
MVMQSTPGESSVRRPVYFEVGSSPSSCVNSLLQGRYMTPSGIERLKSEISNKGADIVPSNSDIIQRCLSHFGMTCINIATLDQAKLEDEEAYLCSANLNDCWFPARKIHGFWIILNGGDPNGPFVRPSIAPVLDALLYDGATNVYAVRGAYPPPPPQLPSVEDRSSEIVESVGQWFELMDSSTVMTREVMLSEIYPRISVPCPPKKRKLEPDSHSQIGTTGVPFDLTNEGSEPKKVKLSFDLLTESSPSPSENVAINGQTVCRPKPQRLQPFNKNASKSVHVIDLCDSPKRLPIQAVQDVTTVPLFSQEMAIRPTQQVAATQPMQQMTSQPMQQMITHPIHQVVTQPMQQLATEPMRPVMTQRRLWVKPTMAISMPPKPTTIQTNKVINTNFRETVSAQIDQLMNGEPMPTDAEQDNCNGYTIDTTLNHFQPTDTMANQHSPELIQPSSMPSTTGTQFSQPTDMQQTQFLTTQPSQDMPIQYSDSMPTQYSDPMSAQSMLTYDNHDVASQSLASRLSPAPTSESNTSSACAPQMFDTLAFSDTILPSEAVNQADTLRQCSMYQQSREFYLRESITQSGLPMGAVNGSEVPKLGQECVGRSIQVLWPADDCWYIGYIADYSSKSKHFKVCYDDGSYEWIDLRREVFKVGQPQAKRNKSGSASVLKSAPAKLQPEKEIEKVNQSSSVVSKHSKSLRISLTLDIGENKENNGWTLNFESNKPTAEQSVYLASIGAIKIQPAHSVASVDTTVVNHASTVGPVSSTATDGMRDVPDPIVTNAFSHSFSLPDPSQFKLVHLAQLHTNMAVKEPSDIPTTSTSMSVPVAPEFGESANAPKRLARGDKLRVARTAPGWKTGVCTGLFDAKTRKYELTFDDGHTEWVDPRSKDVKHEINKQPASDRHSQCSQSSQSSPHRPQKLYSTRSRKSRATTQHKTSVGRSTKSPLMHMATVASSVERVPTPPPLPPPHCVSTPATRVSLSDSNISRKVQLVSNSSNVAQLVSNGMERGDAQCPPQTVADALQELKKLGRPVRKCVTQSFCRYCGANASGGWGEGPWGARTLCRFHSSQFRNNELVLDFSVAAPMRPEDAIRPELNTEMVYMMKLLRTAYAKNNLAFPYDTKTPSSLPPASNKLKRSSTSVGEYIVERILNSKFINDTEFFLVKWANYDESESTWEEASNLNKCSDILNEFRSRQSQGAKS